MGQCQHGAGEGRGASLAPLLFVLNTEEQPGTAAETADTAQLAWGTPKSPSLWPLQAASPCGYIQSWCSSKGVRGGSLAEGRTGKPMGCFNSEEYYGGN